jgi:hypothetical protein
MRRSICTPMTVSARHVLRSGGIWTSIIASGRIRVLLPERRIVPTSTTCRCSLQPEFRRRCRDLTPAGLRSPCVTPRQRHTTLSTGRGSTYRGRNTVSTKPATSPASRNMAFTASGGFGPSRSMPVPVSNGDPGQNTPIGAVTLPGSPPNPHARPV